MSERYVARISVEKIIETPMPGRGDDRKTKHTIANIVVGNDNLDAALQNIKGHLEFIDDGGDIDG